MCRYLLGVACLVAASAFSVAPPLNDGWSVTQNRVAERHIFVQIALKHDQAVTSKLASEVVEGAQYKHHELRQLLRPSSSAVAIVTNWLRSQNVDFKVEVDRVFTLSLLPAKIESVFGCRLLEVVDSNSGQTWHRADRIVLPQAVARVVSAVYGLYGLPTRPRQAAGNVTADPTWLVTPEIIRRRYGVNVTASGNRSVRQAVAEFQGQFINQNDLTLFFNKFVPTAKPGQDHIYRYNGNNATGYGIEALLDVEYIMGIAPGLLTEFWGYKNFDFCSDLKRWTTALLNDSDVPLVHSVSYGYQGSPSDIGCTTAEVHDIDNDLMALAAKGITIIFASGDGGSGEDLLYLYPSWPASSPWVTAVGSTAFTDNSMSSEMATTQFGSGSGFAWDFPIPAYQATAVSSYLSAASSSLPIRLFWNRNGRGTADVSALGEQFQVTVQGYVMSVGGTSAAAPTFAALVSLLNDKLVAAGKRPLGFLNPFIYKNPQCFTDITVGSDKISRMGTTLLEGFNCLPGWDPPTGMGTPRFGVLLKALGLN